MHSSPTGAIKIKGRKNADCPFFHLIHGAVPCFLRHAWVNNMKGKLNSDIGDILIDNAVIAKCAGNIAVECFGIVGMATVSVADGIVKLVKRENLAKGINVEIDENNEITIDFHVIVAYGVSISAVADNLISNVKYQVEEITGLVVKKINIYVEGVRVID